MNVSSHFSTHGHGPRIIAALLSAMVVVAVSVATHAQAEAPESETSARIHWSEIPTFDPDVHSLQDGVTVLLWNDDRCSLGELDDEIAPVLQDVAQHDGVTILQFGLDQFHREYAFEWPRWFGTELQPVIAIFDHGTLVSFMETIFLEEAASFNRGFVRNTFAVANLIDGGVVYRAEVNPAEDATLRHGYRQRRVFDIVFDDASFHGMSFENAQVTRVRFRNADLRGSSFDGAMLHQVDFTGAMMTGCSFVDTQFIEVTCPDGTRISNNDGSCSQHLLHETTAPDATPDSLAAPSP